VDVLVVVGGWVEVVARVVAAVGEGGDVVVGAVPVVAVVDIVVWVNSGATSGSFVAVHATAITATSVNRDIDRVTRRLERPTISNHFPDFSTRTTLRARS
jgi:hypothetical protein